MPTMRQEILYPPWLFEGRPRQGKKLLPGWLDWLSYLAGSSKSHREISISCIFLQSPYQVDIKNDGKWWTFLLLLYFTTLETYCVIIRKKIKKRRHIKRVANEDDILTFSQSN
jgi:hypothetical protein